jgi:hypothetical protein
MYNVYGYPGPKGDSAYEIAVKLGFVGDYYAWLASLKGKDGASPSWTASTKTGSDIQISTGASTNTLYYGNFITVGGGGGGSWATSTKTGADIQVSTGNTNTLYYANFLTTAQSPGAYLTTAQAPGNYLTTAMISDNTSVFQYTSANSKFVQSWELKGNNTSGTTGSNQGGTIYFSGGNNITLSGNSNTIIVSGPNAGGAQTGISGLAGSNTTFTSGTVIMSADANLTISSSINGASQYIKFSVGNYITTAMNSTEPHYSATSQFSASFINTGQSSNFILSGGSTTASTAGSDFKITLTSAGLNFGIPKWLTTAMISDNTSVFQYTSNTSAITSNAFATANSTNLVATSASSQFDKGWSLAGANTAGTTTQNISQSLYLSGGNNVTLSGNLSTIVISIPNLYSATSQFSASFLNTGQSSNFILTGGSTTNSTAGSDMKITMTSAGLNFGIPKWLTTAMISDNTSIFQYTSATSAITSAALATSASSNFILSGGSTTNSTAGSDMKITMTSAGLNFGIPKWLTTAMISDNTSIFLYTSASSNASTNAFASTATTKFAGTGTSATNATITLDSKGLAISVAAPGGGGGIAASIGGNSTSAGGGYSNITSGTMILAGGNNITLSQNGSVITISGANAGGAQTGISGLNVSDTTYTSGSVYLSAQNNITLGSSVNGASQYVRFSVGNYITTAMISDNTSIFQYTSATSAITANALNTSASSNFILTGGSTTASTAGSDMKITMTSAGLNFGIPKWLTTAMISDNTSVFQYTSNTSAITSAAQATSATSAITASAMNTSERSSYISKWSLLGNTAGTTTQAISDNMIYLSGGNMLTLSGSSSTIVFSVNTGSLLGTGAAASFLYTSASSNASTNAIATSASSQFDKGWSLAGANTAGTTTQNISQSLYLSGGNMITLSGNASTIVFSVNTGSLIGTGAQSSFVTKWSLLGNTSGTTTQGISNNVIYLSGGSNITLSGNGSTVNISGPINILNSLTIGGNTGTTGSSNITGGGFVIAGGSNITISQSNNTISFHGATANGPASLYFQDGGGVSWTSSSNGSTTSISVSSINPGFQSFYENFSPVVNTQTLTVNSNSWIVFPFVLPQAVQFNYMRFLLSQNVPASTTQGTTANTSLTASQGRSLYYVIYSQGTGGSSNSIQYLSSTSAGITNSYSCTFNANGSQYTNSFWHTFPGVSGTAISKSTAHAMSVTNQNISFDYSSALTGPKVMDIPFAGSLSEGQYWLAIGESSTSNTNVAAATRLLSIDAADSYIVGSQANNAYGPMGVATAVSSGLAVHQAGSWTTNVQGTTASIALTVISSSASHNKPYFQLWKRA